MARIGDTTGLCPVHLQSPCPPDCPRSPEFRDEVIAGLTPKLYPESVVADLRAQLARVTAERDEARGQRDNYCSRWLRAGFDRDTWKQVAEKGTEAIKAVAAQRDQARKELERVTAERDAERAEHTRWVLKNAVDAHELKQARKEVAAMEAALGATVSKGDAEKAIRLAQLLADEADARAEAAEAREAELRADVRAACDRLSEGRDGIPATGPMWSHGVVYAVREFRALAGEKVELALTGEDE